MIGLDSNILLRWIVDDPSAPEQCAAVRRRLEAETQPLFVNHIVLAEAVWVLHRFGRVAREDLMEIMERLLRAPEVRVQQAEVVEAALRSFQKSSGGFADHLIGEINRRAGCRTTLTFDKPASKSPAFTGLH